MSARSRGPIDDREDDPLFSSGSVVVRCVPLCAPIDPGPTHLKRADFVFENKIGDETMEIYAKIGTGPQSRIRVKYKRLPPQVGDTIEFRSVPAIHRERWRRGTVDMIKDLYSYNLYYVAL